MLKRHFLLRAIKTQVQLAGLSSTQGSPKALNPCYCVCRNTEKRPGGAGESRTGEHPAPPPALPPGSFARSRRHRRQRLDFRISPSWAGDVP